MISLKPKARHVCAVLGVAIAVGTVVFMRGLTAANDYQAVAVAERILSGPFFRELRDEARDCGQTYRVAQLALDYRPGGRVMQGPPMMVTALCRKKDFSMHCSVQAMMDAAETNRLPKVAVTSALFAQRRLPVPEVGTELTLVGRRAAYRVRIGAVIDSERSARGLPNLLFFDSKADGAVGEEWSDWSFPSAEDLAPGFRSDAGRNFDRAKALLLWAAALTALCLLVNTLFLTIEAKRKEIAILRMVGETRGGIVRRVFALSLALTVLGDLLGIVAARGALALYVGLDPETFPLGLGPMTPCRTIFVVSAIVAVVAALAALKPALAVRPLEAASDRMPRKRHFGMTIAFACGFGAFVAVEVWGASLMKAFVPSAEWPDAIVSILPCGVSSFDIGKLRNEIVGVKRIHELAPLQVNLAPLEEMPQQKDGRNPSQTAGRRAPFGGMKQYRNALLLGSDWLPDFRFVAGERASAEAAIRSGDSCIITEMMARARKLKLGDRLELDCGRGLVVPLEIVGIVDCNWHMVTSRALVRGLNRMPVNTDGPVFVSFDTVEACDPRPAPMVKMTHLWLDYEPCFLAGHGVFEAGRLVEKSIVSALGLLETEVDRNTVRLHARDEIGDGTLAHGADLIGAMARVPFIFIGVVSLGFVAMLVALVDARRRELFTFRTVGATRGQLARLLAGEALKVAAGGILFGLPGGALAGWLFTWGTRAAMSNWGIPPSFAVPVPVIAEGALGAVAFALAVAVPTSLALVSKMKRR